jgi:hypothetical protein
VCRPATARALTVGGTLLAVVGGLAGWGATSASTAATAHTTVVQLAGGARGTGHPGMSAAAMAGMNMSAAKSDPAQGAYLSETPHGRAQLTQSGDHLTGSVTVSGLPPGSHHAEGVLGVAAGCSSAAEHSATYAVALPDLVANLRGVAHVAVDLTVDRQILRRGYVLRVDQDPTVGEIDEIGSVTSSSGLARSFAGDPVALCGSLPGR